MSEQSNAGIYIIRCQGSQKIYIGQTARLKRRWNEHLSRLNKGTHDNQHLQRMFDKYSESAFEFETLCSLKKETVARLSPKQIKAILTILEQCCINLYSPQINQAPAAGSQLGYRHSAETRARMSEFRKNWYAAGNKTPMSREARAKMSATRLGTDVYGKEFELFHAVDKKVAGRNLRKFCRDRGLDYKSMQNLKEGRVKSYRNYFRSEEDFRKYTRS